MKKSAIIAMIFFLSGGAARAGDPEPPAEYIPSTLTFEAPANQYQEWTKKLPCPAGHFSTVITVSNPAERADFQSGALIHFFGKDSDPEIRFGFNTKKYLLPLWAHADKVGRTSKDILSSHQMGGAFTPGASITLEVTWTNSRSFLFVLNGHEQYTISLSQPVTDLRVMGVGSRSVFDKNAIQCNLIS